MSGSLNHSKIIEENYRKAEDIVNRKMLDKLYRELSVEEKEYIELVCEKAEANKGVLTVIITSLVHKIYDSSQDIRLHQDNMSYKNKKGYSGRGIDTRYITPFMKKKHFPSMSESGWLTRSLEQNRPYSLDYTGSIKPTALKQAFLKILYFIEEENKRPEIYLQIILSNLIIKRDLQNIDLAKPTSITIDRIIEILKYHFEFDYGMYGAARLPVIAIYSVYQSMISELKRFEGKSLLSLEEHTSSDVKSGRVGDVEVVDEEGRVFEAIEVKHNIAITLQLVKDSYEKFKMHPIKRYYILTTADKIEEEDKDLIKAEIKRISNIHGCQVIVNGIYPSLKYYFRMLKDTFIFIDHYVDNIKIDRALKFKHKEKWNEIIALQ